MMMSTDQNTGKLVDLIIPDNARRRGRVFNKENNKCIVIISGKEYSPAELKKDFNYETIVCSDPTVITALANSGYNSRLSDRQAKNHHITLSNEANKYIMDAYNKTGKPISNIIDEIILLHKKRGSRKI